jgi:WD40 repeat protein
VHRDVKPSNIIFVNGVPKLADIGLVTGIDATRSYVGTEGFAAPEGPGSTQADLYSLGKVLYEIATGKDRQEFPELPTNLRELPDREGLRELNAVIARACRHDPKDRYRSAAEMRAELELLQSGKSLARLHRAEARLRLVQRGVAALAVLAVLVGAGWAWQARQTATIQKLARTKAQLVEELANLQLQNRQQLAHLNIANGIRALDEGDSAGALLWFGEALPLVSNNSAQESNHRVRIQQALDQTPRVLRVIAFPKDSTTVALSPDGRRLVSGNEHTLHVVNSSTGAPILDRDLPVDHILQAGFASGGKLLFISSLPSYGFPEKSLSATNVAAVLDTETGRPLVYFAATNLVRATLCPNGLLVTADTENTLRVHAIGNGEEISRFSGHTGRIFDLCVSRDERVLASRSDDQTVRLWRLPSGAALGSPLEVKGPRGPMMLSPDGALFAIVKGAVTDGSDHFALEIWDVEGGTRVGAPIELEEGGGGLEFLPPDGRRLLVLTGKAVQIIDPRTQQRVGPSIVIESKMQSWACSADGERIALGGKTGVHGIWSLTTGEQLQSALLRDRLVRDIQFRNKGGQLVVFGEEVMLVLSLRSPKESAANRLNAPLAHHGPDPRHRLTEDRRHLLLPHGSNGKFSLVDLDLLTDWDIPASEQPDARFGTFTIDRTGRQAAISYSSTGVAPAHFLELWRMAPGGANRLVLPFPPGVQSGAAFIEFDSPGSHVMAVGSDRQVRVWKTADGRLERVLPLPEGFSDIGDLTPGPSVFGAYQRTNFARANLTDGSVIRMTIPARGTLSKRIFDPSGTRVATVVDGQSWTQIYSLKTGRGLSPILEHGDELRWAAFSPDWTRLLTVGHNSEARVWDWASGDQIAAPLRLGNKPVSMALWSLDGQLIVAHNEENLVRVWEASTGQAVTPILKHDGYIRHAILGQHNRLITVSLPDHLRVWNLTATTLAADVVAEYAKLASGRRINKSGAVMPLEAASYLELCRSLQRRAPNLFEEE